MYLFSGEELKAKAPPVERCMLGNVIYYAKDLGDVISGHDLNNRRPNPLGKVKIVNGSVGRRNAGFLSTT